MFYHPIIYLFLKQPKFVSFDNLDVFKCCRMRVKAQVTVNNRMLSNQGGNCKPKGKPPISSLAIGRKAKHLIKDSEKDPEVFVLHCTAQNRAGFKYAVRRGNVEKVFTRFVDEGKAGFIFKCYFGGFEAAPPRIDNITGRPRYSQLLADFSSVSRGKVI